MSKGVRYVGSFVTVIICAGLCIMLVVLRMNGTIKAYSDDKSIEEDINKAMKDEDYHYATDKVYTLCVMDEENTHEMPESWINPLSENGLNMSGYDAAFDTAEIAGYALGVRGYRPYICINENSSNMKEIPRDALVCVDISYCSDAESKVYYNKRFHNRTIGSEFLAASLYVNLFDKENVENGISDFKNRVVNPGVPYALVNFAVNDNTKIDKETIINNGEGLASGILAALDEDD